MVHSAGLSLTPSLPHFLGSGLAYDTDADTDRYGVPLTALADTIVIQVLVSSLLS